MLAATLTALTLSFVIRACASTPSQSPSPSPTPPASLARLTITPATGLRSAKPQRGIVVTATGGTIIKVTVETSGESVTGTLNATSTTWRSRWALNTGTSYMVRATAVDAAGRTVTQTTRFRTLTPDTTFRT